MTGQPCTPCSPPPATARPLLVLLHGTCLNAGQWDLYADLLADVAEVAAPDLPGHGTRAAQPFTLDAAVQVVQQTIAAHTGGDHGGSNSGSSAPGMAAAPDAPHTPHAPDAPGAPGAPRTSGAPDKPGAPPPRPAPLAPSTAPPAARPVVLGGHSLGGFVAMTYAQRHPTRLQGLALMGSATEPRGPGAAIYRAIARLWELAGPARVQWLHERTLGRRADPRLWAAVQAHGGESFGAVRAAWADVMRHCGSRQLRHVACPVLVLGGRLDQLHLQAARFAAAAPQGRVITARGRGHLWPLTHPAEVAARLRPWLAALPGCAP